MGPRFLLIVAALLALASPWAAAGGRLDAPVATLIVKDSHPDSCGLPGFCPAEVNASAEDPGNATVDLSDRFEYVGVATNDSLVEDTTGYPLLPDSGLVVQGRDLYVRHPLTSTATHAYNNHVPDYPGRDHAGVEMSPQNVTLNTPGVAGNLQTTYLPYSNDGVGYDQEGPFNTPGGNDTDTYLGHPELPCHYVDTASCWETSDGADAQRRNATPDVNLGFSFNTTQLATDPARLNASNQSGSYPIGPSVPPWSYEAPQTIPLPLPGQAPIPSQALPPAPPPASAPAAAHGRAPAGGPRASVATALIAPAAPRLGAAPLVAGLVGGSVVQALLSLYSRIASREEVLDSRPRREILERVGAHRVCSLAELTRATGMNRNAVTHHLRKLAGFGLVRLVREDRQLFVMPVGEPAPGGDVPLRVSRHTLRRRIVDALEAQGGQMARVALHDALSDAPERTRNYTLRRMEQLGVLRSWEDERGERHVALARAPAASAPGAARGALSSPNHV